MGHRKHKPQREARVPTHPVMQAECSKLAWRSRAEAKRALTQARARRRETGQHERMEQAVYRCPRCDWWHLTSRPKSIHY